MEVAYIGNRHCSIWNPAYDIRLVQNCLVSLLLFLPSCLKKGFILPIQHETKKVTYLGLSNKISTRKWQHGRCPWNKHGSIRQVGGGGQLETLELNTCLFCYLIAQTGNVVLRTCRTEHAPRTAEVLGRCASAIPISVLHRVAECLVFHQGFKQSPKSKLGRDSYLSLKGGHGLSFATVPFFGFGKTSVQSV